MEVRQGAHRHSSELWQLDAEMVSELLPSWGRGLAGSLLLPGVRTASGSETESRSVVSDSFQPHALNHGILQARGLEWVAFPFCTIFPTQGLNPGLLHYRGILYQLSHKGSPRIPEWVAYPFSRGSSQPRNRTRVSCIAGRFFIKLSYQGSPLAV